MSGLSIVATTGSELMAKYNNIQTGAMSLSAGDASVISNSDPDRENIYYSQNSFKRYMGYKEPDYLMVSGLYASVETSPKSKVYGNFLVKRADYVAKALNWYTEDGILDTRRAETAIRTACRKKAPNGLYYMYSMSNKDHYLSDKGGSRLYMSGRRYKELYDEGIYLKNKYNGIASQVKVSEFVPPQITQDYQRMKYMLQEVVERHRLVIYSEGAIKWMADRFIQELTMKNFEWYCDFITSEWYCDHVIKDRYCPRLVRVTDIYNKYKKIMRYAERHQ